MSTLDNYSQWEWQELQRERWLARCPKCSKCGEPIQEAVVLAVDGDDLCVDCINEKFGIDVTFRY